jgi:hypothetical protein
MKKLGVLLVLTLPLWAGMITHTITIDPDQVVFKEHNQYTIVEIKGADQLINPGEPVVPRLIHHFVIPPSAEVTEVEVFLDNVEALDGTHTLLPGQEPIAFSMMTEVEVTAPNQAVYSSSDPYPATDLVTFPTGDKTGFRLCELHVYPLHYIPSQGEVRIARTITVQITYQEGVYPLQTITERQYDVAKRAIKALVSNPEDIDQFKPIIRADAIDDCNYAIVIGGSFEAAFEDMRLWKTKKGYNAEIVTVSWITSNYTGYDGTDTQARIKDFFADYYANKGLIFAVLGGDVATVSERDCYNQWQSPNTLACDWYFADIDDWDADNDGRYGEPASQQPDAYHDIYVGRIPVDNTTEISNYWTKLEMFEKNPPTAGIQKIVLPSGWLWQNLNYHGRYCNNKIDTIMMRVGFTAGKLEEQGAPATRNWINSNQPQFGHPCGHGNDQGVYNLYTNMITNSDVPYFTNNLGFIMNSMACYPGNFDGSDDCFAERLITNNTHSGVNAIFNCRYGWGTPPQFGPSENLDTTFYSVFVDDTLWIGVAHAHSVVHWRGPIWSQWGVWHYCGCELNLFGDPEVHGYHSVPTALQASHSSEINCGVQYFSVTVTDGSNPVEDALVCLYKDSEVHVTDRTDSNGEVFLTIDPQTEGTMYVTGTAFDYLPYEGSTTVVGIAEVGNDNVQNGLWINSNVVKDHAVINYAFGSSSHTRIKMYNVAGAMVQDVYNGQMNGTGSINVNTSRLPAGIYFVTIEHDNMQQNESILIVR